MRSGKAATWTSTTGSPPPDSLSNATRTLPRFLTREAPPQPLIARRHYFQTGTLRYFEAVLPDRAEFQADLFRGVLGRPGEATGAWLYCLPRDADDRESMRG